LVSGYIVVALGADGGAAACLVRIASAHSWAPPGKRLCSYRASSRLMRSDRMCACDGVVYVPVVCARGGRIALWCINGSIAGVVAIGVTCNVPRVCPPTRPPALPPKHGPPALAGRNVHPIADHAAMRPQAHPCIPLPAGAGTHRHCNAPSQHTSIRPHKPGRCRTATAARRRCTTMCVGCLALRHPGGRPPLRPCPSPTRYPTPSIQRRNFTGTPSATPPLPNVLSIVHHHAKPPYHTTAHASPPDGILLATGDREHRLPQNGPTSVGITR